MRRIYKNKSKNCSFSDDFLEGFNSGTEVQFEADVKVCCIGTDHILCDYGNVIEVILLGCSDTLNIIAKLLRFLISLTGELTRNNVVSLARSLDEVERNSCELCRCSTLKEEYLVVVGNVHKLAKHSLCIIDDGFIIGRAVGHLHYRHS